MSPSRLPVSTPMLSTTLSPGRRDYRLLSYLRPFSQTIPLRTPPLHQVSLMFRMEEARYPLLLSEHCRSQLRFLGTTDLPAYPSPCARVLRSLPYS